jgi:hypothetical protein
MRHFLSVLFFYVTIIHFLVRGVLVELSSAGEKYHDKNELDYYLWEQPTIFFVYTLPYFSLLWVGLVDLPFLVLGGLAIFVSILRSIEHVNNKIIE